MSKDSMIGIINNAYQMIFLTSSFQSEAHHKLEGLYSDEIGYKEEFY